jgi:hypothetical protein
LATLGRIYTKQAYSLPGYVDGVAIDNPDLSNDLLSENLRRTDECKDAKGQN